MPTPCTRCEEIFDLNDGCASNKYMESLSFYN